MVQWLQLRASSAGGSGSIPGRGTKIPHASWFGKKKKKKMELPRGFLLMCQYQVVKNGWAEGCVEDWLGMSGPSGKSTVTD